jgi:spermidine synthase
LALSVLYSTTLFFASALLFLVEPFFAKLVLPRFGGAPAVWNTCMVFFQTALLLGYLYSDVATTFLRVRVQVVFHLLALSLPLACLPLAIPDGWVAPVDASPVWSLLGLSFVAVGLPFLVVSTTAPTLQRWFATLDHRRARDPYFLYAASNAGSIGALAAYPFVIEPVFSLAQQARIWSAGYVVVAILIALCAMAPLRLGGRSSWGGYSPDPCLGAHGASQLESPLSWKQRFWWLTIAFIPSSLMLGVTTHISTDIAAVPLLWVLPLGLYLLTFVLAFASHPLISHSRVRRVFPVLVIPALVQLAIPLPIPVWLSIPLHLTALFGAGMFFHGRLAETRPPVLHLTQFYVWLSVGGLMGGVFNALVAPWAFAGIYEYPLVLALACFLHPSVQNRNSRRVRWVAVFVFPLVAGAVVAAVVPLLQPPGFDVARSSVFALTVVVAFPVLFSLTTRYHLAGVAVSVAALVGLLPAAQGRILYRARSFFGTYRVVEDPAREYHLLYHGTTLHGRQDLAPGGCEPLTYYARSGPAGSLFEVLRRTRRLSSVAVIGLGTGSLACYADAGERWTFYEIDPLIDRIARDGSLFTFVARSQAPIRTIIGDGRLSIQREPRASLDLLVLDAFSSDAIPIHLTTSEAVALYVSRLRADGVIAFHISNQYLDLEPALATVAGAQGLIALTNAEVKVDRTVVRRGTLDSSWVVLTRSKGLANSLRQTTVWRASRANGRLVRWTDESSNVLGLLK